MNEMMLFFIEQMKITQAIIKQEGDRLTFLSNSNTFVDKWSQKQLQFNEINIRQLEERYLWIKDMFEDVKRGNITPEINLFYTSHKEPKKYKANKGNIDNNKQNMINYDIKYRKYKKIESNIPKGIMNNLINMPANKGYIYNGLKFYGEKKMTKEKKYILFEKNKNNKMLIHEICDKEYKILTKNNNTKSKVISNNPKKFFVSTTN